MQQHIETSNNLRRMSSPILSSYPWTTGTLSREDFRTIVDSHYEMVVRLIMKEWACLEYYFPAIFRAVMAYRLVDVIGLLNGVQVPQPHKVQRKIFGKEKYPKV